MKVVLITIAVLLSTCGVKVQDSQVSSVGSGYNGAGIDYVEGYLAQHLVNLFGVGSTTTYCETKAAMGINYEECKRVLEEGYRFCLLREHIGQDWGICLQQKMNAMLSNSNWSVSFGMINKTGYTILQSNLGTFTRYLYGEDMTDPEDQASSPKFGANLCGSDQTCKWNLLAKYEACLSPSNLLTNWNTCTEKAAVTTGVDYIEDYLPQHLLNLYGSGDSAFCGIRAAMGFNYDECRSVLLETYKFCLQRKNLSRDWGQCNGDKMRELLAHSSWRVDVGANNKSGYQIIHDHLGTFVNYLFGEDMVDPEDQATSPKFGVNYCGINQICKSAVREAYTRCLSTSALSSPWAQCAFVDERAFMPKHIRLSIVSSATEASTLNLQSSIRRNESPSFSLQQQCILDHYCNQVCNDDPNYQLVDQTKTCDEVNKDDPAARAACHVTHVANAVSGSPLSGVKITYRPPYVDMTMEQFEEFKFLLDVANYNNVDVFSRTGALNANGEELVEVVGEAIIQAASGAITYRVAQVRISNGLGNLLSCVGNNTTGGNVGGGNNNGGNDDGGGGYNGGDVGGGNDNGGGYNGGDVGGGNDIGGGYNGGVVGGGKNNGGGGYNGGSVGGGYSSGGTSTGGAYY